MDLSSASPTQCKRGQLANLGRETCEGLKPGVSLALTMAEELLPAARTASNFAQWPGGGIARGVEITASCLCRRNAARGGELALCCSLSDGARAPKDPMGVRLATVALLRAQPVVPRAGPAPW